MNSYQTDYPVMDLSGKFVGVLTRARLIYALKEVGPDARVVDVMLKAEDIPIGKPNQDLSMIWETMVSGGSRVVAIKNGAQFLGLLTLDDISEVFQIYGAKMQGPGQDPPPLSNALQTKPGALDA